MDRWVGLRVYHLVGGKADRLHGERREPVGDVRAEDQEREHLVCDLGLGLGMWGLDFGYILIQFVCLGLSLVCGVWGVWFGGWVSGIRCWLTWFGV